MQKLFLCLFILVALLAVALTGLVFAPVSAQKATNYEKAENYDAVQLRVYCKTQPGLLRNVYIMGNDQNNLPHQWRGTSQDHYSVTTSNFWWQGYVYVQWQMYNGSQNHAYYRVSSSTNNPYPGSVSVNCQTNTPLLTPTPTGVVPNSSPSTNTVQQINVC